MELIFNNQLSILIDILPFYLTSKQCIKYYSSNNFLYKIYLKNNKFENNYFMPKTNYELQIAVNEWCINKKEAIIKYGYINNWNTIYITEMNFLFLNKKYFNDNINDWNTSNVIHMVCMFYKAEKFNQDINLWNINDESQPTNMLRGAKNFDKLNCSNWNLNKLYD